MTVGAPPVRFPIRIGPRSARLLRLIFGVTPETAYVDVGETLHAQFGRFQLTTPISNLARWSIEGPWWWITAVGVRRGIRRGDVTFGGNHRGGVRIDFHDKVPWGVLAAPTLYVTVADMAGLGDRLSELGIPGKDARKSQ